MNRRGFLKLLGAGLPATVVAEKIGLVEKVRSYFFAPAGGWYGGIAVQDVLALQLETMAPYISDAINHADSLAFYFVGFRYYDAMPTGPYLGISRTPYPKVDFDKAVLIG